MNNKEISFVIGLILFVGFIFIQTNHSNNVAKSDCNIIYGNQYNCVIVRKEQVVMDHGLLKLHCLDLDNDSSFIFFPYDIIPANLLYYHKEKGDTLFKNKNSNYFLILNGNKRDSFVFNCKGWGNSSVPFITYPHYPYYEARPKQEAIGFKMKIEFVTLL